MAVRRESTGHDRDRSCNDWSRERSLLPTSGELSTLVKRRGCPPSMSPFAGHEGAASLSSVCHEIHPRVVGVAAGHLYPQRTMKS
jgi:hypothetical protein